MELTEQQRMDLINAGWVPPRDARMKALDDFLSDSKSFTVQPKLERKQQGEPTYLVRPGMEVLTYTAEEYNAALERYRA